MFPVHDDQESRQSEFNRQNYIDMILEQDQTCLHRLYRYATSVIGVTANAEALVDVMNKRAHIMYPNCPIRSNLKLSKHHFWFLFYRHNDQLIRHTTKTRLSQQHMEKGVLWAKMWKNKLKLANENGGKFVHYCFLDEKWFFTTSRRSKIKVVKVQPQP